MMEHIYKWKSCSTSFKTSSSGVIWSLGRLLEVFVCLCASGFALFLGFFIAYTPNPQRCVPSWCMNALIFHHLHCPKGIQLFWQFTNRNTAFDVAGVFDPTVDLNIKMKVLDDTDNWLGVSRTNQLLIWHAKSCLNHTKNQTTTLHTI